MHNKKDSTQRMVATICDAFPDTQAVYLFGTSGTDYEREESDVDIAVLLPPVQAHHAGSLMLSPLRETLETLCDKSVDLINLRRVPTTLQIEVIKAERLLYVGEMRAVREFEMLTLSAYQKLNEERAELIQAARAGERFVS